MGACDPGSNPGSPTLFVAATNITLKNIKMSRTKKVKATGKYGVRYGTKVKEKLKPIEAKQRKKQTCPYCGKKKLKRLASSGIWVCKRCGKKFASDVYYLSN